MLPTILQLQGQLYQDLLRTNQNYIVPPELQSLLSQLTARYFSHGYLRINSQQLRPALRLVLRRIQDIGTTPYLLGHFPSSLMKYYNQHRQLPSHDTKDHQRLLKKYDGSRWLQALSRLHCVYAQQAWLARNAYKHGNDKVTRQLAAIRRLSAKVHHIYSHRHDSRGSVSFRQDTRRNSPISGTSDRSMATPSTKSSSY